MHCADYAVGEGWIYYSFCSILKALDFTSLAFQLSFASCVFLEHRGDYSTVCHLLRQVSFRVPKSRVGSGLKQQFHNIRKFTGRS